MKTRILSIIALAALPVMCSLNRAVADPAGAPATAQTPATAAQAPATAQTPATTQTPTTTPAPGAATNPRSNPVQGGVNRSGNSDVNGEGGGVYQNGTYYRNGTYGYNTNLGTGSGYANTNSLYWTTNPPESGSNQRNSAQPPGNTPAPITSHSQLPGNLTPPPANSTPPQ